MENKENIMENKENIMENKENIMENKENIIAFDFQGWKICKLNLRDIIKGLGATLNTETNKWEIEECSDLDTFPIRLTDDGMGYGVDEEYIIDVCKGYTKDNELYCHFFTVKQTVNDNEQ